MSLLKFVMVFVIICNFAYSSYAIKCYYCSTDDDSRCNNNVDPELDADCLNFKDYKKISPVYGGRFDSNDGCMRIKQEVGGQSRIVRICSLRVNGVSYCEIGGDHLMRDQVVHCDECNTDYCNDGMSAASGVFSSSFLGTHAQLLKIIWHSLY